MENYAKLTQPTYREIGHYFGHSSDGRTPLGGRMLRRWPVLRRERVFFCPFTTCFFGNFRKVSDSKLCRRWSLFGHTSRPRNYY